MASGRRRFTLSIALSLCLGALVAAPIGQAAPGSGGSSNPKRKLPLHIVKGHVFSDGTLSVGKPEFVTITDMPPRARFRIAVEPLAATPQCSTPPWLCDLAWVGPAPGSLPFRTSGKGNAYVAFITPVSFKLENFEKPSLTHFEPFVNGQRVHVDVEAIKARPKKHRRELGIAIGRAGIDGPPPTG
jgi:hypothetical protein